MNKFKIVSIAILVIVLASFGFSAQKAYIVSLVQQEQKNAQALGSAELNRFIKAPTNTSVSCGTSSTLAVATSTARQYIALVNDGATTVYLGLGTSATSSSGIRLNASGGSYEMGVSGLFTGSIFCMSSATSTLTVVEANTQ